MTTILKLSFHPTSLLAVLALALAPAPHAIAADSANRAALVKEKIQSLRSDCAKGRLQIRMTLEELDRLSREGVALRPQFEKFKAELVKMEDRAKGARERADAMREKGGAFFSECEELVNSIQNEDIRKEAANRLAKRKKSYDRISSTMQEAKAELAPFMSDLNDIRKLLETELSASSVASAKSTIRQARWHAEDVLESLVDVEKELDRVAAEMAKYQ
jgi:chromosome segregation ATPase